MDALIFAAGLGSRLRPLTDHTPKPLIDVGGVPMLERVALRLISAGADRLIINTHHLGEQIVEYVAQRNSWGVEVCFSRETDQLLDTGGGLVHAAPLFRKSAPFFIHNADIVTDLPLEQMYHTHEKRGALATLAVMDRPTSRGLIFDRFGLLGKDGEHSHMARARFPHGELIRLAFAGVHVVSPKIFSILDMKGAFSIWTPYLHAVAAGHRILPFRVDGSMWFDIGSHERLAEARAGLSK